MTCRDLCHILLKAIEDGHGDAPVYFDTEARTFSYHMAKVGRAYCEDMSSFMGNDEAWIILHEERYE